MQSKTLKEIIEDEGKPVKWTIPCGEKRICILVSRWMLAEIKKYAIRNRMTMKAILGAINEAKPSDVNLSKAIRIVARYLKEDDDNEIKF